MLRKRIQAPTRLIALACAATLAPGSVLATETANVEPKVDVGSFARVKTSTTSIEGTISSIADDKIEVSTDEGLRSFPRKEIVRLDIRTGRKNHALLGGLIGGAVGLAIGALAPKRGTITTTCNYTYDPYGNRSGDCSSSGGSNRAVMIVVGGAVGIAAGGGLGFVIRSDKWKNATRQVQVTASPDLHGGVRFALSASF